MFSSLKKWVDTNIIIPTTDHPSNNHESALINTNNYTSAKRHDNNFRSTSFANNSKSSRSESLSSPINSLNRSPSNLHEPVDSPNIDLSHLSKKEQEQIAAVLERAKNEELIEKT